MNPRLKSAITGMQWVLGVVVLLESIHFALSPAPRHLGHGGLPQWLPPVLGGTEALAALLFLLPPTRLAGSYALLLIFGIAAAIHLLHGQFDVGGLLIYGMAVWVCMSAASLGAIEVRRHEVPLDR